MKIKLTSIYFLYGNRFLKVIMRTFIFLFSTMLLALTPENVVSQNSKIKIEENKALSVDEVFDMIMSQTDYKFFYEEGIFDDFPKIRVKKGTISTNRLLKRSLSKGDLDIALTGNNAILIKEKVISTAIKLPQSTVSGIVMDQSGQPLPGANILEKGTTNGTQTDFDGNFAITVTNENAILVISYLGFSTQEVAVNGQTNISITLQEDAAGLDEIVVIGYGTAKRKNLSGAISSVKFEDSPIALAPNTNVMQALRGSTPGINIGAQTEVGQTPNILVRGQTSISGNNSPLIVLDGVVYLGELSDINPSDIASADVLKDASAAAAYGSRSGNGVIMITSKKGKTDKALIRYSTSAGVNRWQSKPNLMGTSKFLERYIIANSINSIGEIPVSGGSDFFGNYVNQRVNTNWLDLVSRTGSTQKHNLSVSGRSDKMNYFFSGGYEKQDGVIVGDQFKRISLRSRLNVDVTDWLNVGIDGSYNNNDFSGTPADLRLASISAPVGYPYRYDGQPLNAAGNTSRDLERYPVGQSIPSALWGTDGTQDALNKNDVFRFTANALFKVPGVEGLTYKLNYSLNGSYERDDFIRKEGYYIAETGAFPDNELERYSSAEIQKGLSSANGENVRYQRRNYVIDNILNYNREFGKHDVDLTLVATRDYSSIKKSTLEASNFVDAGNTILGYNGLSLAGTQINSLDIIERSNVGYLARVGYAFDSKYHLNASYRRDGASVFGQDNKYGDFYSIGGAWTVTNEDFLNDSDVLNYLKVNGSYGVNGSQGVDPYETLAQVVSGPGGKTFYEFGDNPSQILNGTLQSTLGNSTLGWEETTAVNIGFQSAWFNNRVFLDVDYYTSKTKDQIFNRQIPIYSGFGSILSSLGQIDNKGLEISLRTINIENDNFTWNTTLNFWQNRNKVAKLYGDDNDGDGVEDDDIANSYFIGQSLGAVYGYDFIGVVQEDDTAYIAANGAVPGDPMFRDIDGVDGISPDDRKVLSYDTPNFRMSLANTFTYKNFTLYTLFAGTFGGGGYYQSPNPYATSFHPAGNYNQIDHPWWTPENKSNTYLRADYLGNRYLGIQSRGFVRLQDISASYKMPQKTLDAIGIGISSVELFATGNNVFTITDWDGDDPEVGIQALDRSGNGVRSRFPVPSTYSLGLNISF